MGTRSVSLDPPGGWDRFSASEDVTELVWEVLAGWHYMNPTSGTSVWEADGGANFYLSYGKDGRLIQTVAGYAADPDPELDDLVAQLRRRFGFVAS